jgi:ribosomal protein L29
VKTSDLRRLNEVELASERERTRRDLLNLRCRVAIGEEVKPGEIKTARRTIARVLTVEREKTGISAKKAKKGRTHSS